MLTHICPCASVFLHSSVCTCKCVFVSVFDCTCTLLKCERERESDTLYSFGSMLELLHFYLSVRAYQLMKRGIYVPGCAVLLSVPILCEGR